MPLFFWFDLSLKARAEISEFFSLLFWEKRLFHKDILKLSDLYLYKKAICKFQNKIVFWSFLSFKNWSLAKLLSFFVSVPLLRENLRELRENKKQIIRTLVNKTFWMLLRSVSYTGILEYPCSLISEIVSKLNVVLQGSIYTSSSFVMTSLT